MESGLDLAIDDILQYDNAEDMHFPGVNWIGQINHPCCPKNSLVAPEFQAHIWYSVMSY
jgi:hypothetical protein